MVARLALRESQECFSTAVRRVVAAVEEATRAVGVGAALYGMVSVQRLATRRVIIINV